MSKNLLTLIFSTILTGFLLEIGFVVFGYGDPILYSVGGKYQYRLAPNQHKRMLGPLVRINSLGMRGTEPNPDKRKIVFFGDSVTYGGNGLSDEETFVSLIDQRISNSGYQALNAGVNGYAAENIKELFLFYRQYLKFNHVVIVIPSVDFTRPLKTSGFFEIYKEDDVFLSRTHFFLKALFYSLNRQMKRLIRPSQAMTITTKERSDVVAMGNILSYQEMINHSSKIFIFLVPSRSENTGASMNNNYKDLFLKHLSSINNNLSIVDLASSLREYGPTVYKDEWHFNADGHRALAKVIFPYINQAFLSSSN